MRWLFLTVALAGCGPNVIVLRDPVTQKVHSCHYGPLGGVDAARCARTMEAAGFVRLGAWAE